MYKTYSSSLSLGVSRRRRIFGPSLAVFLSALLLLLPLSISLQAQAPHNPGEPRERRHEERHQIEVVEEQWRQAILHADVAALGALLDDDYMAVTASGMLKSKEQTLEALRTGKLRVTSMDLFDRRVRFYGKTALVTGRIEAAGSTNEGDMSGNYRYTQVFVRNEHGDWKIASFEINRIREPKEHREHESKPTSR